MEEIHLTKKDFNIEWYSGQGAGGQRRNKVKACCRITHIESGITCIGTKHAHRIANQKDAFTNLANLVVTWYNRDNEAREISNEVIRNYHAVRNEVHDKESGLKQPYKYVVVEGNIGDMLKARLIAKGQNV